MKLFIICTCLLLSLHSHAQQDTLKVGQPMPSFTLQAENDQALSSSDLKGKVVLINFFATWCAPCLQELPVLQHTIWDKYKDNNNFKLLVIGRDHTRNEVDAFKKKYNFPFTFYPDKGKRVYSLFANIYIPRNYLIDKNGTIVFISKGFYPADMKALELKLEELLK